MIKIKQVDDNLNIKGKRILLRVDLNVPINDGSITETSRIKKILSNIRTKSIQNNIDPKITKRIWLNMIKAYIDFERRNFKKK